VGGLVDTVIDNHNGFAFNGTGQDEQVAHLVQRMAEILALHQHQPEHWQAIRTNARNARFLWSSVAGEYLEKLYVRA
jgi:glycogen synthase